MTERQRSEHDALVDALEGIRKELVERRQMIESFVRLTSPDSILNRQPKPRVQRGERWTMWVHSPLSRDGDSDDG